jgi:hypothetical protein
VVTVEVLLLVVEAVEEKVEVIAVVAVVVELAAVTESNAMDVYMFGGGPMAE